MNRLLSEYQDQLQTLQIRMEEYTNADYEYQTTVATVIDLARKAKTVFENCSEPIQKRAFLKFILQNPSVKGKTLYFSIATPFNLVLELSNNPDLLPLVDKFRTLKWTAIKRDIEFSKIFEMFPMVTLQN